MLNVDSCHALFYQNAPNRISSARSQSVFKRCIVAKVFFLSRDGKNYYYWYHHCHHHHYHHLHQHHHWPHYLGKAADKPVLYNRQGQDREQTILFFLCAVHPAKPTTHKHASQQQKRGNIILTKSPVPYHNQPGPSKLGQLKERCAMWTTWNNKTKKCSWCTFRRELWAC